MATLSGAIDVKQAVGNLRARAQQLFDALRSGSLDHELGGVTRDSYGRGEQFAHDLIAQHAASIGLEVWHDDALNSFMVWAGHDRELPAVVIGSHLDSVAGGGNFDGAAGVVAGLIAVEALKGVGFRPRRDVIVMAVRAEESAWFHVPYVGSRAALGRLPAGALAARRVDTGRTLEDHVRSAGGDPQALRAGKASLTSECVKFFFEVHIEQAPTLAESRCPIGVGTAIPGNFRFPEARVIGEYGHVGLPRRFRNDAALAGAEFALALDRIWAQWDRAGRPMAITIGEFHTNGARHAMTKVPGEFAFSLDVRAYEERDLEELLARVLQVVSEIEIRRGVRFELGRQTNSEAATADAAVMVELEECARRLGIPAMRLASPASHDAATFFAAGIPFAMLFVRNPNGSHHSEEAMDVGDFLLATAVLAEWLVSRA
ncbi:MAG: Zn-dependent hydrolase [Burkholderiaceae bacterium]|nr:Zn-dependent hydrolase [Burkholderiaceae bacterium]